MGQDPDAIRQQIEETRSEMADTVDALGHKADVRSRAKESVQQKTQRMRDRITGASSRISDATPEGGDVKRGARQAVGVAQENPIGLALGAVATGFVAGMLIPSTRVEDEKLGPTADEVKRQAKETGEEALERGKQVAQEAAQSAAETATERGREQGEQLRESTRRSAQDVVSSSGPPSG